MHLAFEAALLLRAPQARLLTPAFVQTVLRLEGLLEVMHTVAYAWARHTYRALRYPIGYAWLLRTQMDPNDAV